MESFQSVGFGNPNIRIKEPLSVSQSCTNNYTRPLTCQFTPRRANNWPPM